MKTWFLIPSIWIRIFLMSYYEAAHRGGCQAKAAYASKASRFMNINILPALKSIDNSIFIIEGEAENNGAVLL